MIADLKPYPEYRKSGVDWLGNVPRHWTKAPGFAAFRENKSRNTGLREKTVLSLSYGKILIKPKEKLHGLVPESFETYQIVEPGDIIIRSVDLQNDWTSLRVGLVRNHGIITSAYLCFKVTDALIPEYGYQMLNAFDLMKAFYGMGSGLRQNLSFTDFKRMPIFIPPPDEQAAIVRFLEYATRRIERTIRAKRKLITLLNEQKQTIIHHAVTQGLDSNVPMRNSGVDWIGEIPAHWKVLALKRVIKRLIDCEHKTAPTIDSSEYYVVRTTAIRNGQLRMHGTYCTSTSSFREWTRRGIPQAGDILFTREAPAGEACIVPDGMNLCLGQRTVLIKPKLKLISPLFLVQMIYAGPPRISIKLASQGSTVGHFNMSDIGAMMILCPPLNEQVEILESIRKQTTTLITAIERTEREIKLLQEYRTRLIADVVTGQLDVREAAQRLPIDDEPYPVVTDELVDEDAELEEEMLSEE